MSTTFEWFKKKNADSELLFYDMNDIWSYKHVSCTYLEKKREIN